jgi:hypothetical protein
MGGTYLNETQLLFTFLAAIPRELPNVRAFRREVIRGQEMISGRSGKSYFFSVGVPGQGDAYAYVRGGLVVEIEAKAAKGRMRDAQLRWQEFCAEFGIPHLVVRAHPKESPEVTVARWVRELAGLIESLTRKAG